MLEKERKVYLHRVTDVIMMIMTRKFKVRVFLGSLATLTAILGVAAPAKAITFNFLTSDNGQTVITKTDAGSGLELTLDQPRAFDRTTQVTFEANSNPGLEFGLKLSRNEPGVSPLPYQFQLKFNQDVKLVSYDVTNSEGNGDAGAFFDLQQGASTFSDNNDLSTVGTFAFNNATTVLPANTPLVFVSGDILVGDADLIGDAIPNDEVFFLDNITVSAVPFEFSPTLGLLAVGGIWGMSRLRKKVTAKKVMDELSA